MHACVCICIGSSSSFLHWTMFFIFRFNPFYWFQKNTPNTNKKIKKKKNKKWVKFFFYISIILLHVSLFYILSSYQLVGYMCVCVCVHKHLFAWKKNSIFFPSDHLIIIIISFVVHVYHSFIHTYMVTRIIWLFFFAKKIMFENCNLQMLQLLCCLAKQHRKIGQKKNLLYSRSHTHMHACIYYRNFFFLQMSKKTSIKYWGQIEFIIIIIFFFRKKKWKIFSSIE